MSGFSNVLPGIHLKDQPMGVFIHGQTLQELREGGLSPSAVATMVRSGKLHRVMLRLRHSDAEETELYVFD